MDLIDYGMSGRGGQQHREEGESLHFSLTTTAEDPDSLRVPTTGFASALTQT